MLFKEITAIYSENDMKQINTLWCKMQNYWLLKMAANINIFFFHSSTAQGGLWLP
jgi:hypothetical protein